MFLVSNCTEEYIDIQDESLQKGSLFKNELSQKQRIIELAEGIKPKIKDYNNQYKKPKKFQRKYGKLDTDNIKIINLPQFNDDLLIIIPFKNNQKKFKKNNEKKEKLFIAYYKNSKKTYTVLRNKNYKKSLRSSTEEGFLTHLEIMFEYVYGNMPPGVNKTLAMKTEYCPWETLMIDQTTCTALEHNGCTDQYRIIDLVEDGWDCNAEELEEVELDVPENCPDGYIENEQGVCVPETNNGGRDTDSDDDDDLDDDCDDLAFDCDTGGGGEDDQQTDKLNTNNLDTTQKQLLDQAVINLQNDCLGKVLYNSINSVNIEVGQTSADATYTGTTNTIRFNTNNDIDAGRLGSEMFHAYQQQEYKILDDIETPPDHTGGSNIEFEEKAFNMLNEMLSNNEVIDELEGTGTHIIFEDDMTSSNDGTAELKSWLEDIKETYSNSNISLTLQEKKDWFSALNEFRNYQIRIGCNDHYCDPIDKELHPDALINLFNNSNCK